MSPHPMEPAVPPEPEPEHDLATDRAAVNIALQIAIGSYVGKKNTPFTRFQIASRLRPLLVQALDMTEKELARHFDIAVTPDGIGVIPKTEWAKALLNK